MNTSEFETLAAALRPGLLRVAASVLSDASAQEAEDVVQDTLIKYMEQRERGKSFETEEHRKAWLIRVDSNLCKNRLRFYKNHPKISVEQLSRYYEKEEDTLLMDSLLLLPSKYREVLLLHYVEGYQGREIAGMLGFRSLRSENVWSGDGKNCEGFCRRRDSERNVAAGKSVRKQRAGNVPRNQKGRV